MPHLTEADLYNLHARGSCNHDGLVTEIRELRKAIDRQHKRIGKLVKKVQKLEKRYAKPTSK